MKNFSALNFLQRQFDSASLKFSSRKGLLPILIFGFNLLFSQAPPVDWFRLYDGAALHDEAKFLRLDNKGNIVVTGRTNSGATATYGDVVTIKYDQAGTVLWTHVWNNTSRNFTDDPLDMEVAANGDVIVCGSSKTSSSGLDQNAVFFVYALDSAGSMKWIDTIRGPGYAQGSGSYSRNFAQDLHIDKSGNILVVGQITGNNVSEYERMVLVKYNQAGQKQWEKYFDSSTDFSYMDYGLNVGTDGMGNAYICGVTTLVTTWIDPVVWKVRANGDFGWVRTKPGPINNVSEQFNAILVDNNGNSYAFGTNSGSRFMLSKHDSSGAPLWHYVFDTITTGNTASFTGADVNLIFDNVGNIILAANMNTRMAIVKFNDAGQVLWQKFYGGTGQWNNEVYHVLTDANNNIYACGAYNNSGSSTFDFAAFKLDENGNELWSYSYDGPTNINDKAHSMAVAADGAVYIAGFSNGHSSSADLYVVKLKPNPGTSIALLQDHSEISLFPNPASSLLHVQTHGNSPLKDIELCDLKGRVLWKKESAEHKAFAVVIALNEFQNGMYLLKTTTTEGKMSTKRFLLQR